MNSLDCKLLGKTNGIDTLQIVKKCQPDLILMDIMLPDVNGIEIFYQLQQDPLTSSIPVVAMTALAMFEEQEQIQEAGFHGCIIKPFFKIILLELNKIIFEIKYIHVWIFLFINLNFSDVRLI